MASFVYGGLKGAGPGGVAGVGGPGGGGGFIYGTFVKAPPRPFRIGDRVKVNATAPVAIVGISGKVVGFDYQLDCIVKWDDARLGESPVRPDLLEPCDEPAPAPVEKPKPPAACDFCGGDNACAEHTSALRAAEKTWAVCGRMGCYESIQYHEERLTAGLFDSPETRRVTRDWFLERRRAKP